MLNPTGGIVRMDTMGSGIYGASRGGEKWHNGVDFSATPGQAVKSPIDGKVIRQVIVYPNDIYYGIEIRNSKIEICMFYLTPLENVIGTEIKKGDIVGVAQDISKKYSPKMKPHVHLRVNSIDPMLLIGMP